MRRTGATVAAVLVAAVLAACGGGDVATDLPLARPSTPSSAPATTTTSAADVSPAPAEAAELPAAEDPRPGPVAAARRGRAAAARSAPEPTGHIDIPAIGLSHATYEGIELATINHGPSHWPGTANPGERGNTVFPGHRTTYSRPFWDIDRLRPGDEVIFTTAAGRFTYHVRETFVVGSRETWIVDQTDGPTFTIFACHPKGSARQRYVVKGDLVARAAPPTTTTAPRPAAGSTTTTTAPPDDGLLPGLPG